MLNVLKSTPVLFVEAIEPCLPFWQERLGFTRPVEVPEGDRLGFVILTNGKVEVMYQTVESLKKDVLNHALAYRNDKSFLFVEVDDIDGIVTTLHGFEVIMPRRETFYGAIEIGYREPGGHYVTFAQFKR